VAGQPLSARIANYDINVTLDDDTKHIVGDMVLAWNNPSDDRIDELQFHLYANAFKNARSTWMREYLHSRASSSDDSTVGEIKRARENGWGWIRITHMEVDGRDVTPQIAFHQPDDQNADDETVIRVPLADQIGPRGTARITVEFEGRVPQSRVRTGWWQDDSFTMVHWFPKIGVYEPPGTRFVPADAPHGRWNCHQFHAGTEFYADFGVYDVRITLPEKYIVGTTGRILTERSNGNGTKTVVAHAEDVHEFAWVADAQFREATDVWRSTVDGREVEVRLLYQLGHESVVKKYLESTKSTLEYVDHWLGPGAYPYPNITVIDPRASSGAGGMEYPMLITGGADWMAERIFGHGLRLVESVTIHEFLHQFWYGIVATNEFEEAWLDEGLTVYSDNRISAELFGEKTSMLNWWGASASAAGTQEAAYPLTRSRSDAPIAEPSFSGWHTNLTFSNAYFKPSLVLRTLENYLGRERFDRVIRTYFERWKFRHPCRNDFIAVVNEVAGENLDWFFDQLIGQPTSLDYAVASIANVPDNTLAKGPSEYEPYDPTRSEDEEDGDEDEGESEDKGPHESTVVFRRLGEVTFPMEVLIEFSDGELVREAWDGRGRVKVYRFARPARVVRAAIDPDHKVPLDVDRANNSLRIEENKPFTNKYTLKGFFWMQSLLQFFAILG
jgi:hypothetical protein